MMKKRSPKQLWSFERKGQLKGCLGMARINLRRVISSASTLKSEELVLRQALSSLEEVYNNWTDEEKNVVSYEMFCKRRGIKI